MPKFVLNKIVKDFLVKKSEDLGIKVDYISLKWEESILWLFSKLDEEVKELQQEKEQENRIKELIDIQMIIDELCDVLKVSRENFRELINQEIEKKWWFSQKLYVRTMEMSEDNKRTEYYRSDPKKYPEFSSDL